MKQFCLISILCCLLMPASFAQAHLKTWHLTNYSTNTDLFFSWRKEVNHGIGLTDLTQSPDSIHFRYWGDNHVIDIWSLDGKKFKGNTICYMYNYINIDSVRMNHLHYDTFYVSIPIKPKNLKRIIEKIDFFKKLAPQDSFQQWSMCTGERAQFEISDPKNYHFKQYHCPWYNTHVPEADTMSRFIHAIDSLAGEQKSWKKLRRNLPRGEYTTDVYRVQYIKP